MTKEDKELLLKDLCARLPYFVKVNINEKIETLNVIGDDCGYYFNFLNDNEEGVTIENIKPYLFPLSSMNEEQGKEFDQLLELELKAINDEIDHVQATAFEVDFYNKHHLDWRGLIPKGLAIDATGLNVY